MKEMLEFVVPLYIGACFIFGLMVLIDWTFGIDKLNPMIERAFKNFDTEIIMPSFMIMICSIISFGLFFIFGSFFYKIMALALGTLSFGLLIITLTALLIGKGIGAIRKYCLSRKKV